jgi:hypothetical protein
MTILKLFHSTLFYTFSIKTIYFVNEIVIPQND